MVNEEHDGHDIVEWRAHAVVELTLAEDVPPKTGQSARAVSMF